MSRQSAPFAEKPFRCLFTRATRTATRFDGRKWYGAGNEPQTYDPADANWKGEDKNLNAVRDQDADGNWTETDFLTNDTDVDGMRAAERTQRAGASPALAKALLAV